MKIFVAGASGRVGRELVKILVDQGHTVVAASRHPESLAGPGIEPLAFDFHSEASDMANAVRGCDAVYFVAGSRGKDLLQTDAFGAVKLMEACEQAGVARYIMLSSLFALEPERWASEPGLADITDYNIAKMFADDWLIHRTDLDYTIVQASLLTEEPGTGSIRLDPQHEAKNPIPDVAAVLAAVLERKNTYGKLIMIASGDTPIDQALDSI